MANKKDKELTEKELKKAAGGINVTKANPGQLGKNPSMGGAKPRGRGKEEERPERGREEHR
jgi:hypothetical protein